jgi:hypothetical protein
MPSDKKWLEQPILITVAGSIIVLIGQIFGNVIPIMLGPADSSDFSISVDPPLYSISRTVDIMNETITARESKVPSIKIQNYHKYIKPYIHTIFLRVVENPKNMTIKFNPPTTDASSTPVSMEIRVPLDYPEGQYPLTIQGIGGDGKRRNTTLFIEIIDFGYIKETNESIISWSKEIEPSDFINNDIIFVHSEPTESLDRSLDAVPNRSNGVVAKQFH